MRRVGQVMGMPISLATRGPAADSADAEDAWQQVLASLREADEVFSTWREDSVLSRLARGELVLSQCPTEVAEVLAIGERARAESHGAFDVRRPHLDPSGVVKGWAVQRASRHLRAVPDLDFALSAGGDMVCHVADHERPEWRVGIEDPHDPSRVLAVVPVRNGAVATSGTAHRGDHIVDARTGTTPDEVASVTVVAGDLTTADVDATSAFALGAEALTWLRGRRGRTGLVVWADGRAETFTGSGRVTPRR